MEIAYKKWLSVEITLIMCYNMCRYFRRVCVLGRKSITNNSRLEGNNPNLISTDRLYCTEREKGYSLR